MYKRMGTPKMQSRFICCKCLQENKVGLGIQRGSSQREKKHIKDLICISSECCGNVTKNMEVRYCDNFSEIMEKAVVFHNQYYEPSKRENEEEKEQSGLCLTY